MISAIGLYLLATAGALLPITNPLSTAPVFLAVTRGYAESSRNQQAKMAAIYATAILLVSLCAGALVLAFFGITLPVLRVAGGLVITRVGLGMLEPSREKRVLPEEEEEARGVEDVAFTPVAMPMIAGPGSIATTIAMATEATTAAHFAGVAAGICLVGAVAWITLRLSSALMNVIGQTGMNVITRLMGLVLICIGIRFIAVGITEGLTGDVMTELLREWLPRLQSGAG